MLLISVRPRPVRAQGETVGPEERDPVKGREKLAQRLLAFFQKDATAVPWFAKR